MGILKELSQKRLKETQAIEDIGTNKPIDL
jgi:hypothetical protein